MNGTTIEIQGRNVYYVERGSGRPLVLVHGNTGSHRWWNKVMDMPGYRTIAPDLPNFGRSDPLDTADIDVYANVLAEFISTLGLKKPIVVGHSLGGAVVMALGAAHPEVPGALMFVDGAAPSGLKTPEAHYPIIDMYRTDRSLMRKALAAVAPTLDDPAFLDELTDDAMHMAGHAFSGNARALERFDYRDRAGVFTGPVLVVWGRKDVIVTEAMARESAAAYGAARLIILEDVGHSVMVEAPGRFKELLADFAGSVKA